MQSELVRDTDQLYRAAPPVSQIAWRGGSATCCPVGPPTLVPVMDSSNLISIKTNGMLGTQNIGELERKEGISTSACSILCEMC